MQTREAVDLTVTDRRSVTVESFGSAANVDAERYTASGRAQYVIRTGGGDAGVDPSGL